MLNISNTIRAAVYLRKSRSDADDVSTEETLRRHKETLLSFAAKQPNISIFKFYEEVVSGDSLYARPQMLQLLQDAEQDLFDAVLCIDIQRLGRGRTSEQGMILETLKDHGIRIITPRKVYDLNNELDEDYAEFESFMARRELSMIKRRMHAGTIKSVQDGYYLPNAPYGYKKCKVGKHTSLEIFEDEAKFVHTVFELYSSGEMGTQEIAYTLNGMGSHPHRSDQWNRTSVAAMIRNPVYIGKVVWNKKHTVNRGVPGKKIETIYHDKSEWLVYDGLHPAIIDQEIFDRANEILAGRYHKPYNDGTIINPLGGILKCAVCGYGMQRRPFNNKKNKTVHLLCSTKGCCKSSRLDYVEQAVIDSVSEKLEFLKATKESTVQSVDFSPIISGIEKELSELTRQKNSLHDFLERGIYDVDTFVSRQNIIAERFASLQQEKSAVLQKQSAQSENHIDEVIAKIENVLHLYWNSTPPEKNALLKSIISGGTYYKEKSWSPNQFTISLDFKDI